MFCFMFMNNESSSQFRQQMGLVEDHCGSPISSTSNYICSSHCFVQPFFSDVQMCTIPTAEVSCIKNSAPLVIHRSTNPRKTDNVLVQIMHLLSDPSSVDVNASAQEGPTGNAAFYTDGPFANVGKKKFLTLESPERCQCTVFTLCIKYKAQVSCVTQSEAFSVSHGIAGDEQFYIHPELHRQCILLLAFSKIPFSNTTGRSSCLTDLILEPHTASSASLPAAQLSYM